MRYFYCPCDAGLHKVNPDFRFYFRLYKQAADGVAILVSQGLAELAATWNKKHNAELVHTNPYPHLD